MPKESESQLLWDNFFTLNPFFGDIKSQLKKTMPTEEEKELLDERAKEIPLDKVQKIQRFWRRAINSDTRVKLSARAAYRPKQAQFILNLRSDEEIKEVLENAAKTKKMNTDEVRVLLTQENALKCIDELLNGKKIADEQAKRFLELHDKYAKQKYIIQKSLNIKKIKRLLELIENGLFDLDKNNDTEEFSEVKKLIKDPYFPEIVVGLFDSIHSHGLQAQQLLTLLELHQAQKTRSVKNSLGEKKEIKAEIKHIYRILNAAGEFTDEAIKYLLPTLEREGESESIEMVPLKDDEKFTRLKSLITSLPPSEQIFYIISAEFADLSVSRAVLSESAIKPRPDKKIDNNDQVIEIVAPSCGVRNAIGMLRYGVENYVPVLPQMNIKSMKDIERGMREFHARLGFLYYPGTPDPGVIHSSYRDTFFGVFAHDEYHSDIISSLPEYAKLGLRRFVDIVRNKTGIDWSYEIWSWVDADYRYFKTKHFDPASANNTTHFFTMLDTVQLVGADDQAHIISGESSVQENKLSLVGIFILMDMFENKKEWEQINLNPDEIPNEERKHIPDLKKYRMPADDEMQLIEGKNYQHFYNQIKELLTINPSIMTKPHTSQMLEIMYFLGNEGMSKKEMHEFGQFVNELEKNKLLKFEKKGNSNEINLTIDIGGFINISKRLVDNNWVGVNQIYSIYKAYRNDPESNRIDFLSFSKNFYKLAEIYKEAKPPLKTIIGIIFTEVDALGTAKFDFNQIINLLGAFQRSKLTIFQTKDQKNNSAQMLNQLYQNIYQQTQDGTFSIISFSQAVVDYHQELIKEKTLTASAKKNQGSCNIQ